MNDPTNEMISMVQHSLAHRARGIECACDRPSWIKCAGWWPHVIYNEGETFISVRL